MVQQGVGLWFPATEILEDFLGVAAAAKGEHHVAENTVSRKCRSRLANRPALWCNSRV
jgi:hypothetical protein